MRKGACWYEAGKPVDHRADLHFPVYSHGGAGCGIRDDSVTLNITMPIGTPLNETKRVALAFEDIIKNEVKGYKYLTTTVGAGGRGSSATYKGSIQIRLPKTSEQIDGAQVIQQKLRAHFADFAGARFSFSAGMRGQMTGSDLDIAIRSDDLAAAMDVAEKIKNVMDEISDIGEPSVDTERGLPQVEVVIDRVCKQILCK